MNRKRLIRIGAVIAIMAGCALLLFSCEPRHAGRPLRAWMRELPLDPEDFTNNPAAQAIRQIGVRGLPYILHELRQKDTQPNKPLSKWNDWLEEKLGLKLFNFHSASECRQRACLAIAALGTTAAPAIPDIVRNLGDPELAETSIAALGFIGPPALPELRQLALSTDKAIQVMCAGAFALFLDNTEGEAALMSLTQDVNDDVRWAAAFSLSYRAPLTELRALTLLKLLDDPDHGVKGAAAFGLRLATNYPQLCIPALSNLLANASPTKWTLFDKAGSSLREFGPAGIRILLGFLSHSNAEVRIVAVSQLVDYPAMAVPHADRLLPLLRDPDPEVRRSIVGWLEQASPIPEQAVPALIAAYEAEEDKMVWRACLTTLSHFGQSATNALPKLARDAEATTDDDREFVLQTIADIDEPTARRLAEQFGLRVPMARRLRQPAMPIPPP